MIARASELLLKNSVAVIMAIPVVAGLGVWTRFILQRGIMKDRVAKLDGDARDVDVLE